MGAFDKYVKASRRGDGDAFSNVFPSYHWK
jgi:hypothetical protein